MLGVDALVPSLGLASVARAVVHEVDFANAILTAC